MICEICRQPIVFVALPSYYRLEGSGEVYNGDHWHRPELPKHDGSDHFYAENFGLKVGEPNAAHPVTADRFARYEAALREIATIKPSAAGAIAEDALKP